MKLPVELLLACVIILIKIHPIYCDDASSASIRNKWTCTCSPEYQGNESYALAKNCSTSCDCSPGKSNGGIWTCACNADDFPKAAVNIHDASCFRTCNCTIGPLSDDHASGKHLSSKFIVVILLLCVMFTTFGFLASVLCYVRRSDNSHIRSPVFSLDKAASCNSHTNLISLKATSLQECRLDIGSPLNNISGCFHKASLLFRSKSGILRETIVQFSYADLESATNRFSDLNIIGSGGSSCVYRGQLKDGLSVAVKRLKGQGGMEADSDFSREIELLSRLHHCHVVPLIGYCSQYQGKNAERLLVFEYMLNGNLRDYLDGTSGEDIEWATRVAIALGAARGLEYLHEAAKPKILHRDVKSTNILLDENLEAKITDLGMAKHLRTDGLPSCSSSPVRLQGTFGYFAPEYAVVGRASLKSDVFSFGVVLLELITGRLPISNLSDQGQASLVLWATPRLLDSRRVIAELPDPRLKGKFPEEEMQIMAYLAKECLLLDPDSRPTMSEVVQVLSSIVPECSRRRNFPMRFVQVPFSHKMGSDLNLEWNKRPITVATRADDCEQSSPTWPARCSLPLSIDRTMCLEDKKKAGMATAECMENLISLTSKQANCNAQDDELVDLTKPRFETFHMTTIQSP